MVKSMTGFGRGSYEEDSFSLRYYSAVFFPSALRLSP